MFQQIDCRFILVTNIWKYGNLGTLYCSRIRPARSHHQESISLLTSWTLFDIILRPLPFQRAEVLQGGTSTGPTRNDQFVSNNHLAKMDNNSPTSIFLSYLNWGITGRFVRLRANSTRVNWSLSLWESQFPVSVYGGCSVTGPHGIISSAFFGRKKKVGSICLVPKHGFFLGDTRLAGSKTWVEWCWLTLGIGLLGAGLMVSKQRHTKTPLKLTFRPENRPFAPKGKDHLPTIHFQVLDNVLKTIWRMDSHKNGLWKKLIQNNSRPFTQVAIWAYL